MVDLINKKRVGLSRSGIQVTATLFREQLEQVSSFGHPAVQPEVFYSLALIPFILAPEVLERCL